MSSEVWKHFVIDNANPNYAKCRHCSKLISRGGVSKTTTGLLKHLQSKHKSEIKTKVEQSPPMQSRPKTVDVDVSKPSTSTFYSKLQLFAKPKPLPATTETEIPELQLGPTSEEMVLDDNLMSTPININDPLSIQIDQQSNYPEIGVEEDDSFVSPESTNVSVFEPELQSPMSASSIITPDKEGPESPLPSTLNRSDCLLKSRESLKNSMNER